MYIRKQGLRNFILSDERRFFKYIQEIMSAKKYFSGKEDMLYGVYKIKGINNKNIYELKGNNVLVVGLNDKKIFNHYIKKLLDYLKFGLNIFNQKDVSKEKIESFFDNNFKILFIIEGDCFIGDNKTPTIKEIKEKINKDKENMINYLIEKDLLNDKVEKKNILKASLNKSFVYYTAQGFDSIYNREVIYYI